MDRVAVGAQYAALVNLRQDSLKRVPSALDHVGRVDNFPRLGAVLGGRVNVIELESGRVSIETAHLTPPLYLDAVSDRP